MNDSPLLKKVMVIDDDDTALFIAELSLQHYNVAEEIILKNSARAALDYLVANESKCDLLPDIIFLDINMPGMNGFGFMDEFEKLSSVIKMKCSIMMLTSSLDINDFKKASANKFIHRFINKPLDKRKLIEIKNDNPRITFFPGQQNNNVINHKL